MSYNNNYESSSYQRSYASQNSSPWPMGIEPFSRPQQNISPMQDIYSSGYNNNRPLLPPPNDSPRGGMHFDYGHGAQRPSVMPMSNGPSRDDVYMPDTGRSSSNYRDSWDLFDDSSPMQSSTPWNNSDNSMNGQGQQYHSPQNFQPSFNTSYNDRSPRNENNRNRRDYQEPIRQRNFWAGGSDSALKRTIRPVQNRYANTNAKWKNAKPSANKNIPPPNKKGPYFCKVCNLTFIPYSALIAHNKTSDHNRQKQLHQNMLNKLTAAKKAAQDPEGAKQAAVKEKNPATKVKKEALSYCTVCKTKFSGSSIDHLASDKHKLNKAMDRPFCIQCQRFFRTPTLFVKHCNSEAHKSGKAASKKEGDNVIDAEFFTLDAIGIYDSEKGKGTSEGVGKLKKKKKKMASLEKITISLPAGSISQDASKDDVVLSSDGDIPVVSITQENGVETKSVSMKPAGEAKTASETESSEVEPTKKDESSDEDAADIKPVGLAFVVPISGFYCQICEQFFKDENVARNDHCISKVHRKKYKEATVEESPSSSGENGAKV